VTDQPERQRVRPTVEGRARLLAAIEAAGWPHVVDSGVLGEYAELVAVRGQAEADAALPEVAAHLATGCAECAEDLRELIGMVGDSPHLPTPSPLRGRGGAGTDDSGIYASELPDPRAAEALAEAEEARRQRLRRVRDWLLIAAAVLILVMGLCLVGMAYFASGQSGAPRLGLTPLPAGSPATGASGRAAPSGMSCPASHPIKGNRTSMIYHPPGGEFYEQTRPEDCFAAPADAEAAGYRASLR
jgi:hypothetical protein